MVIFYVDCMDRTCQFGRMIVEFQYNSCKLLDVFLFSPVDNLSPSSSISYSSYKHLTTIKQCFIGIFYELLSQIIHPRLDISWK